jgi:SAM-dependent methyltransferase
MSESTLDEQEQQTREWWNSWSDSFQEQFEEAETEIAVAFGPGVPVGDDLGLLGDVDGTRAIELGCGGGQFGLALARNGADVTGVDLSEQQLAHARENAAQEDEQMEFVQGSVTDMSMIADESYELAFSAFALQWVEDLAACFEEAYRVLEPDGRLVFSVDHPFYRHLDPESGEITASYFADSPRREYSEEFDAEMVIYRRKVSDIVQALLETGFTVEALKEPGYADPEKYDSEFGSFEPERMARVPPTLVVAAQK